MNHIKNLQFSKLFPLLILAVLLVSLPAAAYTEDLLILAQMIIPANSEREIRDTHVVFNNDMSSTDTMILMKSGATLKFTDSWLDLANIHNRTAIEVEEGASLIFDHSEISGANGMLPIRENNWDEETWYYDYYSGYIVVKGGSLKILNGSVIKNNKNNGNDNW